METSDSATTDGGKKKKLGVDAQLKALLPDAPSYGDVILYRIESEQSLQIAERREEVSLGGVVVYMPTEGIARVLQSIGGVPLPSWLGIYTTPPIFVRYLEVTGWTGYHTLSANGYYTNTEVWEKAVARGRLAVEIVQQGQGNPLHEELHFCNERYQVVCTTKAVPTLRLTIIDRLFGRILGTTTATHRLYKTHVIFGADNRPMFALLKSKLELHCMQKGIPDLQLVSAPDDGAANWLEKGERVTLFVGQATDLPLRPLFLLCLIGVGFTVLRNGVKYEVVDDVMMSL